MSRLLPPDLGAYLKEQRQNAQLSLRQLSELAGVSNPYLSQIERGLKKPSAEILQQLARGLQVSAESLYVRAGILEAPEPPVIDGPTVLQAIAADPELTTRQRDVLVDIYVSFTRPDEVVPAAPSALTTKSTSAASASVASPLASDAAPKRRPRRTKRVEPAMTDIAAADPALGSGSAVRDDTTRSDDTSYAPTEAADVATAS